MATDLPRVNISSTDENADWIRFRGAHERQRQRLLGKQPVAGKGAKEEGRWVTIDDRPVYIGGPRQGGGVGAPGIAESGTPVTDALRASRRASGSGKGAYHSVWIHSGKDKLMLDASDINKIGLDDFLPDKEYERIQYAIERVRRIVRDEPDFVRAIDRNGHLMVAGADRDISYNIMFTANEENTGAGSGGPGSAKVFYLPYEFEGREALRGFSEWDKLGLDPIYVLVHEMHHAFGSGTELDVFSDIVTLDIHLGLGNTLIPDKVRRQIASMLGWASLRSSQKFAVSRAQTRKALKWLSERHKEAFMEVLEQTFSSYGEGEVSKAARRIARW